MIIFETILIILIRIVTPNEITWNEIEIIRFIVLFTYFLWQGTSSRLMIFREVLTLIIPPIRLT